MGLGRIQAGVLPALLLAAAVTGGAVAAEEPPRLDPAALDLVTAGGAKRATAAGVVAQAILPGPSRGLVEVALKLAGRQPVVVTPPNGGTGSTGGGKKSITLSGKKTFKAERVTKPHTETLVVRGSAGG